MSPIQIRTLSTVEPNRAAAAYAATRVRILVADHLSIEVKDISDSFRLTNGSGVNSLHPVELLSAIEEEFHCDFSDGATDTMHTVGDVVRHLMECNHHRTPEISLADSAKIYWLRPVMSS